MMELFSSHKIMLIVVAVLIAIGVWFAMTQQSTSTSLLSTQSVSDTGGDSELVATLLALRAVKLDGTIFTDPAFTSLQDFSTQIVPEPIGRPNPFAPLNSTVAPSTATTQEAQIFAPTSPTKAPKPGAKKTVPAAPPTE